VVLTSSSFLMLTLVTLPFTVYRFVRDLSVNITMGNSTVRFYISFCIFSFVCIFPVRRYLHRKIAALQRSYFSFLVDNSVFGQGSASVGHGLCSSGGRFCSGCRRSARLRRAALIARRAGEVDRRPGRKNGGVRI
jgi:hypothetical protein